MQLSSYKSINNKEGYTLIEILMVIAISGILFTIGFLGFQSYSRQQNLIATVRAVQTDIKLTKQNAISGNVPATCNAFLNGYQFNVTSSTTYNIDAFCTANKVTVKTVTLPADFTISSPNPNPITFKSLAQGTNIANGSSTNLVITQKSTGKTVTITIGAGGNVQ